MKQLANKVSGIWVLLALCSLCLRCRFAQAQQGFVSIDCGASKSYTDSNGLKWIPDEDLDSIIYAGNVGLVAPPTNADAPAQFSTIRYFPGDQSKYCYVFNSRDHGVVQGNAYLVRASFWVGPAVPYETRVQNTVTFKLLLYADNWDDVLITLPQTSVAVVKEIYVVAMKETLDVCVTGKDIGMDIPFISSLVLRPLSSSMASVQLMIGQSRSRPLSYMYRINYGAPSADTIISYLGDGSGDSYDRVWQPDTRNPISTTLPVATNIVEKPPLKVMQTAYQSDDAFNLTFTLPSGHFYHFATFYSELSPNVTLRGQRVFKLQVDNGSAADELMLDIFLLTNNSRYGAYMVYSITPFYIGDEGIFNFAFSKENGSIYGPIICGLELLQFSDHDMPLGTDSDEVATLKNIVSSFSSLNTWSGDPCLPYAYNWITCTADTRPFISTISLSNKSLAGEIPTGFKDFKSLVQLSLANNELSGSIPDLRSLQYLKVLDLQGNNLSGPIPDYLGELLSLTTLNLDHNNFSGQIPSSLVAKASSNKLEFSVAGNPFLCNENNNEDYCKPSSPSSNTTIPEQKNKKGNGALVAGVAAGAAVALIVFGVLVFCIAKQKKKSVVVTNNDSNKQDKTHPRDDHHKSVMPIPNVLGKPNQALEFTFQAIKTMTRNFDRIVGQGGFGLVYHGLLQNGKEVAVKLLAEDSPQGEQEFLNEVELLSRVHHKNLVSLVGYCIESRLVLVYEFMANGSLFEALHGKGAKLALWRDRLHIAVDAAEGLDYLHRGCNPSIIHRDVKSSNILLSDQFEGKISDFGISKSKQNSNTMAGGSQMFTAVQGSFGYLDPAYAETNIANHSIDVFAFGIVLFELITGKPPLIQPMTRGGESRHLLQWAMPQIEQGDISRLVDPTLYQEFNVSSMWKVIDVAMMCVEHDRRKRPTMSEIVVELKSALSMELQNNTYDTNSSDPHTASTYTTQVHAR